MNTMMAIEKDVKIYDSFKSKAINSFKKGRFEQALDYAYLSATLAWKHPIGIWYDDELEHLLSEIGNYITNSEDISFDERINEYRNGNKKITYIVSHLYDVGGHSRALKQWVDILSDKHYNQCVYVTNVTNTPTTSPYIIGCLKKRKVEIKQLTWYDSYVSRIIKLINWIEMDLPDILILFTHPNDVIAISSLLSIKNKPYTIFFNHADHVFWLGKNVTDLLIDWRSEGAKISRIFRNIDNIKTIPLITNIKSRQIAKDTYNIPEKATISVSIGSLYKVLGDPKLDYFKTIRKLLEMFPSHYHLFVCDSPENVSEKYLPEDQDIRKRLIITGPFSDLGPVYGVADFLIETFPLAGGTVRVEAMACKLPIVAFRNIKAPILSESDALPSGYPFIAITTEEILKYCSDLIKNPELRCRIGSWLYEHYKQHFSPEKIHELLISAIVEKNNRETLYGDVQNNNVTFSYDISYVYKLLVGENEYLQNRCIFFQSVQKITEYSLFDRIGFYIQALRYNEFKSRKKALGGIVLAILGWRGANLYWQLKTRGDRKRNND